MKYTLKQGLRWCMLSMAVSASAQVSAPVASTQLPTGGKVMSGTTSIQSVGNVLNINQSSQRSAINWNTFNVGIGAKVNFIQPSASSVTLNRVLDTNGSQILGSINANGQVFISNPNGVLFGPNSQVNVGGLIATTQNISVDNFMAGKSTFEGTGAAGSVVNQGTLEAALGGYIALLAPSVRNEGVVLAREGTVAFAAGDKTVVQFNGPQLVTVMVDRPVLDALVENKQMVRADGGLVIFSARSANAVLSSVIKNTGTIQAQTIENKNGRILLMGDMQNGSITIDGKLDASAPTQGDGGFIETSAAKVNIANTAVITTLAKNGNTGNWLVDPHDYTVAASGGDQTGASLSLMLGLSNVTLQSASGKEQLGSGNLNINDAVFWRANTRLTLTASRNVNVNANIEAQGTNAGLTINPNSISLSEFPLTGDGVFLLGGGASINLPNVSSSSLTALVISNLPYKVINSLGNPTSTTGNDLEGINGNLSGRYALGRDIDASVTSTPGFGGFRPIGGNPINSSTAPGSTPTGFSGEFNGLGHTIKNLSISYGTDYNYVGMFSRLVTTPSLRPKISNLNLTGSSISGSGFMGTLVGSNEGGLIDNVSASGSITQRSSALWGGFVGGLVGYNGISESYLTASNSSIISNSSSSVLVNGFYNNIGGLVGRNDGQLNKSYSTGAITINSDLLVPTPTVGLGWIGGLVGTSADGSSVTNSFSRSPININASNKSSVGGLVGFAAGTNITDSYSIGPITFTANGESVGGLVGTATVGHFSGRHVSINTSYSKSGILINGSARAVGGFVGNGDKTTISNSYATGDISVPNPPAPLAVPHEMIGGFAGNLYSTGTNVQNSYSSGRVIVNSGAGNIAGFAGGVEEGATISNSFWDKENSTQIIGVTLRRSGLMPTTLSGLLTSEMQNLMSRTPSLDPFIWTQNSGVNAGMPILSNNSVWYVRSKSGSSVYGSSTNDSNSYSLNKASDAPNANGIQISGTPQWFISKNGSPLGIGVLTSTSDAASYQITYSSGLSTSQGDYLFVPGSPNSWNITPASLTIKANNFPNKTYGDTIIPTGTEFTVTAGSFKNSDASSALVTLNSSGFTNTANVGSFSVSPSGLSVSGISTSNYSVTYSPSNLTVTPAPLTLKANALNKTYGDTLTPTGNEFSVTSGSFKNSDASSALVTLNSSGFTNTANAGSYSVSPRALSISGIATRNYSVTYNNSGSLTVTPALLTLTANALSKTYGDTYVPSGTEFTGIGFKNSDASSALVTLNSSGFSNTANSGNYSVFPTALSGIVANNYSITYNSSSLKVNKADAIVTGLSRSSAYDGKNQTINGFTASGLVNGETTGDIAKSISNPDGIVASTSGRFSGTYANIPSGTANNYNLQFVSGQLVITGCPSGPPCGTIGPQTTSSNITPVVIPAMAAPSFSSAVVTTASPTNSAAPVINFASSSGGGSFGSGGGSTTISNTNTTINSVNATNVTTSSGNPTATASPAASTTTTTIVNVGATPANPATNVINIAANAPSGSTTPTQVIVAQGNAAPTSSPNTVTTTAPTPTSPVTASATPNNTTTATATPSTTTTINTVNATNNVTVQNATPANQAPTNTAGTPTNNTAIPQPATGVVVANNNPNATQVNVAAAQPNVVTPQRLADILSKKDPVEISSSLPPTQVAQLSPEQVAPLIDSLSMRQLMSLTNEQIAKFDPARQAELLNIIKVLKDNPEKAAEKAFTPTDKTFAQLAANGLLKEQIDTLSTRVNQINQNRTTVNIDSPQKLAELLTKKDPVEIASALPSNQVAQLTPEQAAPLISSLTVRQLLALTNEQISKLDPARQTELLNIINVIKNNPEKAAEKAYTAIDKTTAQYVANGLMKDQIDALASKVTQITQSKTTINIDTPQKLAEILSKNNAVEVATALPSNVVPQLTSDQVAPLINALSVKQLLSLTNEQMSKLDPARLAELLNIIKGLKDTPEKAIDKTYTPEDKAVAQYAANGLLKDPIERLSLRANYIANNKSVDPLNKELADLTNPPVSANIPVTRNAPNQANRPLNAAQLAAQNANRETPNLTPAQVAALNPKDLGPLLSQLNANQLMAITNAQMASLEGSYLNQLTILLNFVQDRASNPVANATPAAGGNRVNNTNIFINQPVAKLAGAALLADQPNAALPTASIPAPNPVLAGVGLTPKQVSELDPTQLAALINQLNANQLMAITNAQMARMDGRALNQLTILMNFVQQRTANNNGTANGNNPANAGTNTNTNINVFVNQPVSRLASNALLNEQPKPNAPVGTQSFTQTNITVNLTPRQISELDPTQLAPLISQLNANQLMAITNTQMARMDSQSINQLNILMNFVQQRALNSNTNTTIYINQPVSQIAAASLMSDQPPPTQIAGAAPTPIATVPLSPLQIAGLTPSQVAPLLNRMNSRQLMAVTDTQMASLDSANLNQLITLLNFIQDSARISPIVTNNFANRPVAGFLPTELNTTQTVTQP